MPTKRQKNQTRPLTTPPTPAAKPGIDIEAKPSRKYGRVNPDFAAMAGWRAGFESPHHKALIVKALKDTSALCPGCGFDLINQRRPDCPECGLEIDLKRLTIQDAPPSPLLIRSLVVTVAGCWIAMVAGGFAWPGAAKAIGLTALFAVQLAAGWFLMTAYTDINWYRGVSDSRRKLLVRSSVAVAVLAVGVAAWATASLAL